MKLSEEINETLDNNTDRIIEKLDLVLIYQAIKTGILIVIAVTLMGISFNVHVYAYEGNTAKDILKSVGVQATLQDSNPVKMSYLGEFRVTGYYLSEECTGQWTQYNRTSSGTVPTEGRTVAVDTSVIPMGTKLAINGVVYVAEDVGGAVKGDKVDIFFGSRNDCYSYIEEHGDYSDIFIVNE